MEENVPFFLHVNITVLATRNTRERGIKEREDGSATSKYNNDCDDLRTEETASNRKKNKQTDRNISKQTKTDETDRQTTGIIGSNKKSRKQKQTNK